MHLMSKWLVVCGTTCGVECPDWAMDIEIPHCHSSRRLDELQKPPRAHSQTPPCGGRDELLALALRVLSAQRPSTRYP